MLNSLPRRRGALVLAVLTVGASALVGTGTAPAARASSTAAETTITKAQLAAQADRICARDARQQAALGPSLVNADKVTRARLPWAAVYLDKIVAITESELKGLAALARTSTGMPARKATQNALRTIVADERTAAGAAHRGDLAGFRAAFNRFSVHGYPTGPDYRTFIAAATTLKKIFPFKVCGKTSVIYP
jgi:hypothetical protein